MKHATARWSRSGGSPRFPWSPCRLRQVARLSTEWLREARSRPGQSSRPSTPLVDAAPPLTRSRLVLDYTYDVSSLRAAERGAVGCTYLRLDPQTHRCSHKAILEYLHSNNFTDAFNSLKSDTGIEYSPDPKAKYAGLLEKKWTSVIRLQKKVRRQAERPDALLICYVLDHGSREPECRTSGGAVSITS